MNSPTPRTRPAIVGLEALTSNGTPNGILRVGPADTVPGEIAGRVWRVAAVIPCFNRRNDLEILLRDVAKQDLRGIDLWCVVVDNASTEPLSTIAVPEGLRVDFVRSEKNTGGSGGFNLGMTHVLSGAGLTGELGQPDFLWWLDSDARAAKRCLREMVKILARRSRLGAVGSSLGDLTTGHRWETGANIVRKTGFILPAGTGDPDRRFPIPCDYLAACSALVRRTAIEKTGLFPENFIYYDDIDWCIQMRKKTGLKVVGAPRSRAYHPPGDRRFVTWGRYYIARNCFGHIDVMGMGGWIRFKRALREVPRAVAQAMMGLDELAALHMRGLRDALDKKFPSIEPRDLVKVQFVPFAKLAETVKAELDAVGGARRLYVHPLLGNRIAGLEKFRDQLKTIEFQWPADKKDWRFRAPGTRAYRDAFFAGWRLFAGPTADVAVVPSGWFTSWHRGRSMIMVTSEGLLVRRPPRWPTFFKSVGLFFRGIALSAKIGLRGPHTMTLPPAPAWRPAKRAASAVEASPAGAAMAR